MDAADCLQVLIEQTKLTNPSWAEVNNFVHFLNEQLVVLESAQIIGIYVI